MTDLPRAYRLLLTSWRRERAGSIQSVQYLAEGLARRGHVVHVACSPNSVLATRLLAAGVAVTGVDFGRGWSLSAARSIAAIVREHHIELIDAQDSRDRKAAILARLVYRAPAKLVITRRQETSSHALGNAFYASVADRIIAISHGVARSLAARGTAADRISVVHTGLDPRRVAGQVDAAELSALRAELGLDPALPTIGVVARRKDQETLLRAAIRLGRPLNLLFVGIGRDARLAALEAELPPGTVTVYTGFRDHILPFYRLLDVKVLPTRREGLSQAVLEALALGVPVVSAAAGGTPEVIRHGETGLLFPPGDADALAGCLHQLLDDRVLAARLAAAGPAHARTAFSADKLAAETEAVYANLLGNGRTGVT